MLPGGHTLAGANDDMSRFGVMQRRGVGRGIQGQNRSHRICSSWHRLIMCVRAAIAPSCSGFKTGQIRAIMAQAHPYSPPLSGAP